MLPSFLLPALNGPHQETSEQSNGFVPKAKLHAKNRKTRTNTSYTITPWNQAKSGGRLAYAAFQFADQRVDVALVVHKLALQRTAATTTNNKQQHTR